jgi:signal transduction histidine kinase
VRGSGAAPPDLSGRDPAGLERANRLAELGTLVAGVAHEINNPITYVIGNLGELEQLGEALRQALTAYRSALVELAGPAGAARAEVIEQKLEQSGAVQVWDEAAADALDGATRIRDLVRDLLSLVHPFANPRESLDLHEVLDASLRLTRHGLASTARLERDFRATLRVQGDRTRLGQVFLNLLSNAIDACRSSGPRGAADPATHVIRVRTADVPGGVSVEIEDSGVGIPAELRSRIFEPFFTTKEQERGTGLGLYITQRIVREHGGSIELRQSAPGGTCFVVRLPESPAIP